MDTHHAEVRDAFTASKCEVTGSYALWSTLPQGGLHRALLYREPL